MANVQAIIVTWNKKKDVTRLLDQLKTIDYPKKNLEITVVDNNSTDGTVQAVEKNYPWVNLIRNPQNLGGAGGFNAGMRWVLENRPDAEYLWLLDNDVMVDRKALKALVRVMKENPDAGICGSKIMDIDNRHEMIEIGAFINYSHGDIQRNTPTPEELEDPNSVFPVDYVAACSLLARARLVRELGIWHEKFFIYWDDMEWGARFNAAGYKVLASNASVVYHPSWLGRTADTSAIWRNYYRTRNSLWFYNNYTNGLKRRILLARMIIRFMGISLITARNYETELSKAFVRGVNDFFVNSYGKKDFFMPSEDFKKYLTNKKRRVCVFIQDSRRSEIAKRFLLDIKESYPETEILAVLPKKEAYKWKELCGKENIAPYTRNGKGKVPWADKNRIMKFMGSKSWDVLLTSHEIPKMGAIWGKEIARVDFEHGVTLASIEKTSLKHWLNLPVAGFSFLLQALISPPDREVRREA